MSGTVDLYLQPLPTQGRIREVFAAAFALEDMQLELQSLRDVMKDSGIVTPSPLDICRQDLTPELKAAILEHFPEGIDKVDDQWLAGLELPPPLLEDLHACASDVWHELMDATLALLDEPEQTAWRILEESTGLKKGEQVTFLPDSGSGTAQATLDDIYLSRRAPEFVWSDPSAEANGYNVTPGRLILALGSHLITVSTLAELALQRPLSKPAAVAAVAVDAAEKAPADMSPDELYKELKAFVISSSEFVWSPRECRSKVMELVRQWEVLDSDAPDAVAKLPPLLRSAEVRLDLRFSVNNYNSVQLEWTRNTTTDAAFKAAGFSAQKFGLLFTFPYMGMHPVVERASSVIGNQRIELKHRLIDLVAYFSQAVAKKMVEHLGTHHKLAPVSGTPTVRGHGKVQGQRALRVAYLKGMYAVFGIRDKGWADALMRLDEATGLSWVSIEQAVTLPTWEGDVLSSMLEWRKGVAAAGGNLVEESELLVLAKDLCWLTWFRQECPQVWEAFRQAS